MAPLGPTESKRDDDSAATDLSSHIMNVFDPFSDFVRQLAVLINSFASGQHRGERHLLFQAREIVKEFQCVSEDRAMPASRIIVTSAVGDFGAGWIA
jgi:hypothetical protein